MTRISSKLKGLSLDRLETLSEIIARGGISKASGGDANKQSQFSRQVAELESWFGVDLLDRSSTPNRPTQTALRIAREVEFFLKEMGSIREESGRGRQTVIFGAGERMIRSYLIPWASKLQSAKLRLVFRNLTSSAIRSELLAKRLDVGILRKDRCPSGLKTSALKRIPMCLLLPDAVASTRRRWSWQDLEGIPLVLLEGDGRFVEFLREKASAQDVDLDAAIECSTLTQVVDAMKTCRIGGFLPKDMESQFPAGFSQVALTGLAEYTDEFVIAWSEAEAAKRPALALLLKRLGVTDF